MPRPPVTPASPEMTAAYLAGASTRECGRRFGMSAMAAHRRLLLAGVAMRAPGWPRTVTSGSAGAPAGAAADCPELRLHEVWEQLTARGLVVDQPVAGRTCQCLFRNLSGAQCEMDLLVTGALVWEYIPLGGTRPHPAARLVLALLHPAAPPWPGLPPAPPPGLALPEAAGQLLAARGTTAQLADVRYLDGQARAEAIITNPAEPARGHARISDESVRWECSLSPGPAGAGLAPPAIAGAIAAALTEYTISPMPACPAPQAPAVAAARQPPRPEAGDTSKEAR